MGMLRCKKWREVEGRVAERDQLQIGSEGTSLVTA